MLCAFEKNKKTKKKESGENYKYCYSLFFRFFSPKNYFDKIGFAFSFIRYHDGFSLPFFHEAIFCFSSDI